MTYNINKNVICMMPWIHMHIWPEGKVFPCCMSDSRKSFGNINDNSISEIINDEDYKKLRKEMLNGIRPEVCSRCYELEDNASNWSLRKNSLEYFWDETKVQKTHLDGTIDNFEMKYMDIRFSNLCNMKCRSCGPSLSSSWYEDHKDLYGSLHHKKFLDVSDNKDFITDLKNYLNDVEEVYFAGGEALITPQHYEVLDYWLDNNKTDIRIRYTTNFSVLKYKKAHVFDYWKKFKDIRVAASLDAMGSRAEYIRKGTVWNDIENNRKDMIKEFPNIQFDITPTISVFKHLIDFHKDWYQKGLLGINNIRINILTYPAEYSITIFDDLEKKKIIDMYNNYCEWLKDNKADAGFINSIMGITSYLISKDDSNLKKEFINRTHMIDQYRKENILETFDELRDWYER